jgi:Rrf2 family nitric oxide-sensitive transcriptional repressor
MIVVSRTFVAINILTYVSGCPDMTATNLSIAKELEIPDPYQRKIAHQLVQAGFLIGLRGRTGGLKLARPPEDIHVGDVVTAIEGSRTPRTGTKGIYDLTEVMDDASRKFIEVLNEHTIADLRRARPRKKQIAKAASQPAWKTSARPSQNTAPLGSKR